jgi:hypothetical protein
MTNLSQEIRHLIGLAIKDGVSPKLNVGYGSDQYCRVLVAKWNKANPTSRVSAHVSLGNFWVSKRDHIDVSNMPTEALRRLNAEIESELMRRQQGGITRYDHQSPDADEFPV